MNDNAPSFDQKIYEFQLDENSRQNTLVGHVLANDLDQTPVNRIVYYKLLSVHVRPGVLNPNRGQNGQMQLNDLSSFRLDDKTGEISVLDGSLLDREMFEAFNLTVLAYNYGDYKRVVDKALVVIYLSDLNDNAPVLNFESITINLREKATQLPRLVLDLNAKDYDLAENGTVHFRIRSINGIQMTDNSDE